MKYYYKLLYGAFCTFFVLFVISACDKDKLPPSSEYPDGTIPIPPSQQRTTGNPDAGFDYLRYGDYLGAGIPYDLYTQFSQDPENLLNRTGDNATISPSFNAFTAYNGVYVVGGLTCFACHATKLNGEFVLGLGNSFSDYTSDFSGLYSFMETAVINEYGDPSPELDAIRPLVQSATAAGTFIQTPFKGVNPAFMMEQVFVAHRDPQTLEWHDDYTEYDIPDYAVMSDVPPLWNVKKKNSLYYNGMGIGDFTKGMMQIITASVIDSTKAREVYNNFDDVLAWIQSLEPPTYPNDIDDLLAAEGKAIFEDHCAKCHGTYDDGNETFPNLFVYASTVGTDSLYAEYYVKHPGFIDWLKNSWFAYDNINLSGYPNMAIGYVAPPLDGVWATAPYLHNGSIPDLEALLNSGRRPTYWRRTFDQNDYDLQTVGWNYTLETTATDKNTYDTTLPGFSNKGHYYGDVLTDAERGSLIEYLKTL